MSAAPRPGNLDIRRRLGYQTPMKKQLFRLMSAFIGGLIASTTLDVDLWRTLAAAIFLGVAFALGAEIIWRTLRGS